MRPCSFCTSRGALCVMSDDSEHCEQCVRSNRCCELAPPYVEMERLQRQQKDFFAKATQAKTEAAAALARANRYSKQRRLALRRLKELGQREDQNILELEIDEMITEGLPDPLDGFEGVVSSGALNSPSPRSSSFLDPALLDSQNRNPVSPQGSS
jgi:hypothetical protein